MAQGDKIKTNKLSIYLIKPQFQRSEEMVESREEPREIEGVGQFFFNESNPYRPDWVKDFFGSTLNDDLRILSSSARGVLLVPVKKDGENMHFAVVFGVGRHMLKDGVIEERFGLKVVLNSLDLASFRSIDKTTLGSVPKHSHEQMSRDVSPADFGIDVEQDLVSSVTGKSRDEKLGKTVSGKDALSLSVKADATNIVDLLSHCYDRFKSTDYKTNFDWIDQIAEVRDKLLEAELNETLVKKIGRGDLEKAWMAVPEMVSWPDVKGFRYLRAKIGADMHDDLDMRDFLKALSDNGTPLTLEVLKLVQVFMISASAEDVITHWPAFRCTYAEMSLKDKLYVLNNGKWYEIDKGFTEQVQKDFVSTSESSIALPDCLVSDEKEYNESAASALSDACCMDGKLVYHGGGRSSIEFCDVYTKSKKIAHIKRYAGSNVLNHLFSQGVVSGELFVSDLDFRKKLNAQLPSTHKLADPRVRPNATEYEVVFGIISDSDKPLDIPFFSKVSLRNARRRLMSYGYQVGIKKIKKIEAPTPSAAVVVQTPAATN